MSYKRWAWGPGRINAIVRVLSEERYAYEVLVVLFLAKPPSWGIINMRTRVGPEACLEMREL